MYNWRYVTVLLVLLFGARTASSQQRVWSRVARGYFRAAAFNPLSKGRILFAGPYDRIGIMRSDDAGATWQTYTSGLEPFGTSELHQIFCVPSDTNIVIAISPKHLYRSTNGGRDWASVDGLGGIDGEDLAYQALHDVLYYGKNFAGPTLRSNDHGASWTITGAADQKIGLCTIAVSPDDPAILITGSENGIIARSTDEGNVWTPTKSADTGTAIPPEVPKAVYSDYATSPDGHHHFALVTRWLSHEQPLVSTSDAGLTWTALPFGSRNAWALEIDQRADQLLHSSTPMRFWVGLFRDRADTVTNGMVQETSDGGSSWHGMNFPAIGDSSLVREVWVLKHDTSSGALLAATDNGLYLTHTYSGIPSITASSPEILTSNDGIDIRSRTGMITSVSLVDLLGREVYRSYSESAHTRISRDALLAGNYFVIVRLDDKSIHRSRVVLN